MSISCSCILSFSLFFSLSFFISSISFWKLDNTIDVNIINIIPITKSFSSSDKGIGAKKVSAIPVIVNRRVSMLMFGMNFLTWEINKDLCSGLLLSKI